MSAVIIVPQQMGAFPVVFRKILEPSTLMAIGLTGSDSIPVVIVADDGSDSGSVISEAASQDGTAVVLSVGNNVIHLEPPMTISITKGVTSGTAGVFHATRSNI